MSPTDTRMLGVVEVKSFQFVYVVLGKKGGAFAKSGHVKEGVELGDGRVSGEVTNKAEDVVLDRLEFLFVGFSEVVEDGGAVEDFCFDVSTVDGEEMPSVEISTISKFEKVFHSSFAVSQEHFGVAIEITSVRDGYPEVFYFTTVRYDMALKVDWVTSRSSSGELSKLGFGWVECDGVGLGPVLNVVEVSLNVEGGEEATFR